MCNFWWTVPLTRTHLKNFVQLFNICVHIAFILNVCHWQFFSVSFIKKRSFSFMINTAGSYLTIPNYLNRPITWGASAQPTSSPLISTSLGSPVSFLVHWLCVSLLIHLPHLLVFLAVWLKLEQKSWRVLAKVVTNSLSVSHCCSSLPWNPFAIRYCR